MPPEKYQNKYRTKSNRLLDWDYSTNGGYFITICVQDKKECLGKILIDDNYEPSAALSEIGNIARDCWLEIPNHFPFIVLDEWVIMPNHIHGIIVIRDNNENPNGRDAINRVSTERNGYGGITGKFNPMLCVTLGTIARWFKGRTTFECHKRKLDFQWQPRFYDHIIRTESTLQKIREYIKYNPLKWKWDRNNPENLWM